MIKENYCSMWRYGIPQSQHCNNDNKYNDDNFNVIINVRACNLKSLVYFNVKTHNIWEGNVTIRNEISIENICSLGFWDLREGMILRRLILLSLECTTILSQKWACLKLNCSSRALFKSVENLKCYSRFGSTYPSALGSGYILSNLNTKLIHQIKF